MIVVAILQLLYLEGVTYVNPLLFEGKSDEKLKEILGRVRAAIVKYKN